MQNILNQSKFLVLVLVIFSFLLVYNVGNNPEFTRYSYFPTPNLLSGKSSASASVWASVIDSFELDHNVQSAQVQSEIRKILAEQDKFQSILKTASPYIYYIYQQTRIRHLPAELALIPIIESEFNPNDKSNKGATGLWQLMPQTAHELGIKIAAGYDGRRNVVASTKAALAYFSDLGTLFKGNWYLAIAAYNCGQVCVMKAVKKSGNNSFWQLRLPLETRLYVPKLLAVAAILENPNKYGIKIPVANNQPYFSQLTLTKSVTLATVAKSSGINLETLTILNPDYDRKQKLKKEAKILLVPTNNLSNITAILGDQIKEKKTDSISVSI